MGSWQPGWERGGHSRRHPAPPLADEYSGQLSDRAEAVLPYPSRRGPAGHAWDGSRAVGRKRKTGGRTSPRPGCSCPASGQRADHGHPLLPLLPRVTGVGQGGPEADGSIPSRPRIAPVSAWSQLVCLAGFAASPQLRQGKRLRAGRGMCPSEQRVPYRLPTARTAARGATGRVSTGVARPARAAGQLAGKRPDLAQISAHFRVR
jgi:hypothetical protein